MVNANALRRKARPLSWLENQQMISPLQPEMKNI